MCFTLANKMKLALIFWFALTSVAICQTVQTEYSGHPRPIDLVLFYDNELCFVARGYGSAKNQTRQTEPGIFVHSKKHNRWIRLTKVSTAGGTFGSSNSQNPEDQKKLVKASVGWDFTTLKDAQYAELPLKSNGVLAFPLDVSYDPDSDTFRFGFMTDWDILSVRTYLFFKRKDLVEAYDKK
jgi:hypothetical protein